MIHISKERLERILSQRFQIPNLSLGDAVRYQVRGGVDYHLLDGDKAQKCKVCGKKQKSVEAETPAELEAAS